MAAIPIKPNAPSEFDLARKRAANQASTQNQTMQDALKRRAASLGNMNGGALMKQQQEAIKASGQQLAQANEGIDTAERAEDRRKNEIIEARNFAVAEREAQQKFAANESALGRKQQQSQFGQSLAMQKTQLDQQSKQFQTQMDLAFKDFDMRKGMNEEQMKLAKQSADLAMSQFDLQKKTEAFNAMQSLVNQPLTKDQFHAMAGILGPEIMGSFGDFAELFGSGSGGGNVASETASAKYTPPKQDKPWLNSSMSGGGGNKASPGGIKSAPDVPPGHKYILSGDKWILVRK